jgi:acyl-CoA synthetase (AMP-forming)/AMP-acid ligase II
MELTHLEEYLERNAARMPQKTALVTDTRTLSWSELDEEAEHAAAAIDALLPDSDEQLVIAMLLANSWEFVVLYLGIMKLGYIAAPVDPSFKSLEIKAIVKKLEPALFLRGEKFKKISVDGITAADASEVLTGEGSGYSKVRRPAAEQVASLLFTSGTTGKPKIVPNTHHNHLWSIEACAERWGWDADDTLLISLPMAHWYGLVMGLSGTLYHGNTLYLHEWFDPEGTLELLGSGKITHFTHVPLVFQKLVEYAPEKEYDLSGIKHVISGSSALSPRIWNRFNERFGKEIMEVYGSSETGRMVSNHPERLVSGSPGSPLGGVEFRRESDGELVMRSPGLFPGYWKNEEATQAKFTEDGWWRTGDVGILEDGRVVLKGRVQERIRKRGYTVYSRDVEWALLQDDRVREVQVMGVREEGASDDLLAYFVVGELSREEIIAYCKENMPAPWRPDRIILLDELPRGRTGKPKVGEFQRLLAIGSER